MVFSRRMHSSGIANGAEQLIEAVLVHARPLRLDRLQALPVDARGASIAPHPLPRLSQDVTPIDPVVQRVEAPPRTLLGGREKLALELSDFVDGVVALHEAMPSPLPPGTSVTKAGPLPS